MIAHNSDHKRIAPTILDIHMSIVSEQWINYSCPMFIDFQTSCLSLYSQLSISRLFIHALPLEIHLSRRKWLGIVSLCLILVDLKIITVLVKRQRIPNGQSKIDSPEKLATQGTHDDEKQNKNTAQYVLVTTIANKPK